MTNVLTPQMMKKGLEIICKQNPEWGVWFVEGPTRGVSNMWDIEKVNRRGGKVLDIGELHFWEAV